MDRHQLISSNIGDVYKMYLVVGMAVTVGLIGLTHFYTPKDNDMNLPFCSSYIDFVYYHVGRVIEAHIMMQF